LYDNPPRFPQNVAGFAQNVVVYICPTPWERLFHTETSLLTLHFSLFTFHFSLFTSIQVRQVSANSFLRVRVCEDG
jgi:hypothetical protein